MDPWLLNVAIWVREAITNCFFRWRTGNFMAPEVHSSDYGCSADVYSIGVTLVACGAGHPQPLVRWNATILIQDVMDRWPNASIIGCALSLLPQNRPTLDKILADQWCREAIDGVGSSPETVAELKSVRETANKYHSQSEWFQSQLFTELQCSARVLLKSKIGRSCFFDDETFLASKESVSEFGPHFVLSHT